MPTSAAVRGLTARLTKRSWVSYSDVESVDVIGADLRPASVRFYGIPEFPEFPVQNGDVRVRVEFLDRLDKMAKDRYGSQDLWWVIAVANNMDVPALDMNPGDLLRIPSVDFVKRSVAGR